MIIKLSLELLILDYIWKLVVVAMFSDLFPSFLNQSSGGQQRRFSFAVAMLQNPPLLILDEPTVGVDPLLRSKSVQWAHDCHMTSPFIYMTGSGTISLKWHLTRRPLSSPHTTLKKPDKLTWSVLQNGITSKTVFSPCFFQVGLMRDGILLGEDVPASLIQSHQLSVSGTNNKHGLKHTLMYNHDCTQS